MASLNIGDKAPDFTLLNQDNNPVRLYDLLKTKAVVLYFYPKDETMGCTAEACAFRDAYEDFQEAGAEVVGVSIDSVASHRKFASGRNLPFILLADTESKVSKAYGADSSFFGLLRARITFVIDRQGTIRHKFDSHLKPTKHIAESLEVIQKLHATPQN